MKKPSGHTTMICLLVLFTEAAIAGTGDSTKTKKPFSFLPSGQISLGYDYGYIPFAQNLQVPSGYFKTEGNFSFVVKQLPFNATFFYTDLKNITGLNNYFRVSFDLQSYRQRLTERATSKVAGYTKKISELQKQHQLSQQKLGYFSHVNSNIDSYFKKYYEQYSLNNISTDSLQVGLPDSLSIPQIQNPAQIDSAEYQGMYQNYRDSIQDRYQYFINESDNITQQIEDLKKIFDQLKNPNLSSIQGADTLLYRNKTERFFGHLKKLDVGLCYPSYSTFLVRNIPVKGINIEYENNNRFYAFTAGTTINNLLFTNNVIQNNLQNTQNLFNFFDFNNLQQGRRIISGKAGIGKKEGDHFFAGAMYAVGQQSYFYDSTQTVIDNHPPKEHNVVFELDGSIAVKKWLTLNLVYGKSSIRPLNDESDTTNANLSQLFSAFRSNAALGKAIFSLAKIKSTITISGRWVDPFFRSYGIGFMRSDNFRYEIKTDHQLGSKLRAGLFYRKDENNLLNLFSYTTILHSGGINLQYKVNKHLSLRGNFNPVFQYSYNETDQSVYTNQNYISMLMVSHHKRIREVNLTSNLSSSYYKLYNGFSNTEYVNITASKSVNYKKFSNNFSASLFHTNGIDSLSGNTLMLYNELSCQWKKIRTSGGIKYSKNILLGDQFGYSLKVLGQITKHISVELRGEKLVLGDFYNSIGIEQYRVYPYIWSSRIIINW